MGRRSVHYSISMDDHYRKYLNLTAKVPHSLRWCSLVLAPASLTFAIILTGFLMIASSLLITVFVGHFSHFNDNSLAIAVLIIAFIVEGICFIAKERTESLLIISIRHLVYRRFRKLVGVPGVPVEARGYALTYPAQISQFGYVVDLGISLAQIVVMLGVAFVLFGANGILAALLVGMLAVGHVLLINRVGVLWEQYTNLESARRHNIQRLAQVLPRAQKVPGWASALNNVSDIRHQEERVLKKRVWLQVANGFLDLGALPTVLSLVAIAGVWLWPSASLTIGIILAARYIYSASQNSLANYRVIRLAWPMLVTLEEIENSSDLSQRQISKPTTGADQKNVHIVFVDEVPELGREEAIAQGAAYLPQSPEIHTEVLAAWKTAATSQQILRFNALATDLQLTREAVQRFWNSPETLSSGERQRVIIALVLAEEPELVLLDNVFASLDPQTREIAAQVILDSVPSCTLILGSTEYLPVSFASQVGKDVITAQTNVSSRKNDAVETIESTDSHTDSLPDPERNKISFMRSVWFLLGPSVYFVILGAVLLAGAEVAFASSLARGESKALLSAVSLGCLFSAIAGSLLFFVPLFRVPIRRLTSLHNSLVSNLHTFARPFNSGSVIGRLGEDFSNMQMSVPSALGSVFFVVVHSIFLLSAAIIGAPFYLLIVVAILPFIFFVARKGSAKILPATTLNANSRGDFLEILNTHANQLSAPSSALLSVAAEQAYLKAEKTYVAASIAVADAYAFRTFLIQILTISLNVVAVIGVCAFPRESSVIAPAAVLYFAIALSSSVKSAVEAVQQTGVAGLTVERVRLLNSYTVGSTTPPGTEDTVQLVTSHLERGSASIALIGPSGVGKSVCLDALYDQQTELNVAIVPEKNPFTLDASEQSAAPIAHRAVTSGRYDLVLIDESFKSMDAPTERLELSTLIDNAKNNSAQVVVVLHSRSNLDLFDRVVELHETHGSTVMTSEDRKIP